VFLMANLGSEMSQLFSHIEKGELKLAGFAAVRADKIITELIARSDMKNRTKEIEILREIMKDVFEEKRCFAVKKIEIEEYFMPFALRAMSV